MVPLEFDPGPVNATAYAARFKNGRDLLAVINKDATQALQLDLRGWRITERLTGPSLEANEAHLPVAAGNDLVVPQASAAIFERTAKG